MRLEEIETGERLLAEYERLADDLKKAEEAKMELGQDYAEEFEARSSAASWLLDNAPALLAAAKRDWAAQQPFVMGQQVKSAAPATGLEDTP